MLGGPIGSAAFCAAHTRERVERAQRLLDEIARRETLTVTDDDVEQEVARYAERLGQAPAALRAQLDKDNGLAALAEGLKREKTVALLLSRATIVTA